jgi:hypothetical protein
MDIANHAHTHVLSSRSTVRSHDGLIVAGYLAVALLAFAAIFWASGGPGMTDGDLAVMAAMPLP